VRAQSHTHTHTYTHLVKDRVELFHVDGAAAVNVHGHEQHVDLVKDVRHLIIQNVFSYDRMCSVTIECVPRSMLICSRHRLVLLRL
jgi:hypothetical protein